MGRASVMVRGLAAAMAAVVAVVIGLLVAVVVGGLLFVQTDFGRRTLAGALEGALSAPGAEVAIGEIGRGLPARLAVENVAIRDEDGVWLTVDRAIVNWRPSALLRGRLHVDAIAADGIEVVRLPPAEDEPEPRDPGEPFEVPSLPVDVQIDDIAIRDVTLGEMVVGERMTLDIAGQVSAPAAEAFRTRLQVERTDRPGLVATLDAELDPATDVLGVDADVAEPEGGLIARLAGLEPYPPVALHLEGRGPLSDWQGRLTATAGELVDLDAAIGIARTETLTLSLSGTAGIAGLIDPPLRAIVEDAVHFDVLVTETAADRYRIDRMVIRSDAIEASATGTVHLDDQTLDTAFRVASRDARRLDAALEAMTVGQIELNATASGALALPEVRLSGQITDAHLPDVAAARTVNLEARVEPQARRRGAAETVSFAVDLDAAGVEIEDPALAGLAGDSLTAIARGLLDMNTMVLTIEEAVLASGPSRLSADGWMNLESGDIDATVETSIGDLSALGEAIDQELSGALELTAHVDGNVQTQVLRDGTVDGLVRDLSFHDPAIDEVIGDRVTFTANYAVDGEQGSVDAEVRAGEALNAQLAGRLTDGLRHLIASYRIEAPRLAVIGDAFDLPIAGAFVLSGTAEGDPADPSIAATARLTDARIAEFGVASAELNVVAENVTRAPSGEVGLTAATEAGPVDVSALFATPEEGRFDLSSLSATLPGLTVTGNADVDLADNTVDGRLRGTLDAPRGVEFAGTRIVGTGDLDVRLDRAAGQQTAAFNLTAGPLAVHANGEPQFQAESIVAKGEVLDALGTARVRADLTARNIGTADALAQSVTITVDGPLSGAAFNLAISEYGEPALGVNARGTLGIEGDTVRLGLQQLQGAYGEYPFALRRPATIVYAAPAIVIDDLALDVAGGRVRADGTIGGAGTAATIEASLPAEVAGAAADMELRGMIEARAELREQAGLIAGTVQLRAIDIVQMIGTVAAGPPVNAVLTVDLRDGTASAAGQVRNIGPTPLVLTGTMPLAIDAETLQPRERETTPIRAEVTWQGDLRALTQLAPLADQRIAGAATIDVAVSGTLEQPTASGRIIVRNGTYEHLVYGTLIRNLELTASVANAQTVRISLTGTDGRAGRLNVEGRADLAELEGDPILLDVDFRNMTLVRRDDVTATAGGRLSYRGTATRGRLSGRVETDGVEVSLLGDVPPTVVTIDVIEVRDGQRIDVAPPPEAAAPDPDETIVLDLSLVMPNRVFVRGRGLDSEWQGNLDITGTITDVRVVGSLEVIRGTFDLVGTEFDLENSAVGFDGDRQITPRLNIEATHAGRDITATIRITGTPNAPELTLTSMPSLPESEILAQVLFGRTSGELGPAELVEIAMALDTLAGGGGVGAGTLGTLRETFGLARLSIGTDEAGEPVVRAGRYITDRIFVETVQGARPGSSKFRAEVELTNQLALEAETGDVTQETGEYIGLRWRYDY
jgi:translocation and assembly module TamB